MCSAVWVIGISSAGGSSSSSNWRIIPALSSSRLVRGRSTRQRHRQRRQLYAPATQNAAHSSAFQAPSWSRQRTTGTCPEQARNSTTCQQSSQQLNSRLWASARPPDYGGGTEQQLKPRRTLIAARPSRRPHLLPMTPSSPKGSLYDPSRTNTTTTTTPDVYHLISTKELTTCE